MVRGKVAHDWWASGIVVILWNLDDEIALVAATENCRAARAGIN
jgi:hypothetical protein